MKFPVKIIFVYKIPELFSINVHLHISANLFCLYNTAAQAD